MKIEESIAEQAVEYVWNPTSGVKPAPDTDTYDPEPLAANFDGARPEDKGRILKSLVTHPKGVTLARTVKALFPQRDGPFGGDKVKNDDYYFEWL